MSKGTPTPFGVKPAEKTTASVGFPPMSKSSKGTPTPFGAKPAEKTFASAGFPPMSSKAPTPFGVKPAEKTSASVGFPPMPKGAPTPFGAKPAEKTSASAGFSPMSSKAPTPFGLSSKPVGKHYAEGKFLVHDIFCLDLCAPCSCSILSFSTIALIHFPLHLLIFVQELQKHLYLVLLASDLIRQVVALTWETFLLVHEKMRQQQTTKVNQHLPLVFLQSLAQNQNTICISVYDSNSIFN